MYDVSLFQKILQIVGPHLPAEKIPVLGDWIESNNTWATKNLIFSADWIYRFICIVNEENPFLDRFYVHLYGVMVDLNSKTGKTLSPIKSLRTQSETKLEQTVDRIFKDSSSARKYFRYQLENAAVIKKLFSQVGEDNLFYIIYLRNKYSHPYLTEYPIKAYLNEEYEQVEFDRKKYDKINSAEINELELFDYLKPRIKEMEADLIKMAENYNRMRFLT